MKSCEKKLIDRLFHTPGPDRHNELKKEEIFSDLKMRPRDIQLKEAHNLGKQSKGKKCDERMNTGMFQHGGIEFSSTFSYAIQSQSNGRFSSIESIKVQS